VVVAPKNIVWLASYPKSGNTWVRFILANLMAGEVKSGAELQELVPDLHVPGNIKLDRPIVPIKTHLLPENVPIRNRMLGAVLVVRNPIDTMISNYHYLRRDGAEFTKDNFINHYLAHGGFGRWLQMGFGTWEQSVRAWLSLRNSVPMLVLSYEYLLKNPTACAASLNQFLNLGRSPTDIEQAVENSSFARMRQIEESDIREHRAGIFYDPALQKAHDQGHRFMRSGRSGNGEADLSPTQQERATQVFGPAMKDLGYLPTTTPTYEPLYVRNA
jgi:hypothetical protein